LALDRMDLPNPRQHHHSRNIPLCARNIWPHTSQMEGQSSSDYHWRRSLHG
jgi:hypothetical protein